MAFATVRDRYSEADIARFYAAGLWRPETFFEVAEQQAQRQPDKVFVTDGTTSLTYRELRDSALALATGLHRMGITPGDRVAVQLPSWAEFNTFGCGSRLLAQAFGYSSRDIQFNPSPVTHTTGLITGFLLPLTGAPDGGMGTAGRASRHRQVPPHGGGDSDRVPADADGRVRPRPA